MNLLKRGATAATVVCCSMTSLSHTRYGSGCVPSFARHGRSLLNWSYQESRGGAIAEGVIKRILVCMTASDKRYPTLRPQPIARSLDSLLRGHPGAKRARALAGLRRDWKDIVGAEFADIASPEKFEPPRGRRPGTLLVKAMPGAALILQHDAPRLVERINSYLGANAVGKIQIRPGAFPTVKKQKRLTAVDPEALISAEHHLRKRRVTLNDRLEKALARLSVRTGPKN